MTDEQPQPRRETTGVVRGSLASAKTLARRNRLVVWVLFEGRRSRVAIALLGAVFLAFLALALLRPLDMRRLLSETSTLRTLFSALLSGAILVVSIVTSISSIVLSQEISGIETTQRRIDASIEFRERAEALADIAGSPGKPAAFLEVILYTIYRDARDLEAVTQGSDNDAFTEQIEAFVEETISETKQAARTLDGASFGTFKVLSAGLHYDHSWLLNTGLRIQSAHGDELTDEERDALSTLIDTLKLFATGRQYFESLYYKREVARLSSMLLYVSLPVVVLISYLLLALDADLLPEFGAGPFAGPAVAVLFIYTLSLAPYVVLTAHVIRVAAITLQTLAAGPFTIGSSSNHNVGNEQLDIDPETWEPEIETDGETRADGAPTEAE